MKFKSLLILIILNLLSYKVYSFVVTDLVGAIATGLGGVVLDRDMGGFNSVYNQSATLLNMKKNMILDLSAAYAIAPFGIEGINNSAFGGVFGVNIEFLKFSVGIGGQLNIVANGLNENRFYLGGAIYYPGLKNFIPFVDGLVLSANSKLLLFYLDNIQIEGVSDFVSTPTAFDLDSDITLSFIDGKVYLGLYFMDLLESYISFVNSRENVNKRQIFIHSKINIMNNFDFYGAINITGTPHIVDRNNFLASSTLFANTYFGIEGCFGGALFIRVGLNEGRLTGGIGLDVANLSINFGVLPITTLSLYYQIDITYKFF